MPSMLGCHSVPREHRVESLSEVAIEVVDQQSCVQICLIIHDVEEGSKKP